MSDGKIGRNAWKTTSDGSAYVLGAGVCGETSNDTNGKGIGKARSVFVGVECESGSERREVLRRRIGPRHPSIPPGQSAWRSDKSAISQGSAQSGSIFKAEIHGRSSRVVRGLGKVVIQHSARGPCRRRAERDKLEERPRRLLVGLQGAGFDNCASVSTGWSSERAYSELTLGRPASSGSRNGDKSWGGVFWDRGSGITWRKGVRRGRGDASCAPLT